jgi:hypothetical protein
MRRIAIGAGLLAAGIIGVALAWSGVRPHLGFGPPPEIAAPATPLRVAPADPGGLTVPEADVPIMSGAAAPAPQILAPPAAPDIAQLQAISGESPPTPPVVPQPVPPAAPHVLLNGPILALLGTAPDQEGAEKIWAQASAAAPGAVQGKTPGYVPAVVNGQSIIRISVGGFMSMQAAQAFCAALTAKGAVCTAAAF